MKWHDGAEATIRRSGANARSNRGPVSADRTRFAVDQVPFKRTTGAALYPLAELLGAALVRREPGGPRPSAHGRRPPERLREAIRLRFFSKRTEDANLAGMRRYHCFHSRRNRAALVRGP